MPQAPLRPTDHMTAVSGVTRCRGPAAPNSPAQTNTLRSHAPPNQIESKVIYADLRVNGVSVVRTVQRWQ